MTRRFPPLRQNAFVVPDLEAALDQWTRVMNVGPFFVYEHVDRTATQCCARCAARDSKPMVFIWIAMYGAWPSIKDSDRGYMPVPPSTARFVPVTKLAAPLTRNSAA